jgi:hypothetical protein
MDTESNKRGITEDSIGFCSLSFVSDCAFCNLYEKEHTHNKWKRIKPIMDYWKIKLDMYTTN